MKKLGLLPKLILGIIVGILIGISGIEFLVRIAVTFSGLFGQFLNYIIPLLIIAFIAPGIAELGTSAGKLLGVTAALSYLSTIIAGTIAFFVGTAVLPMLIPAGVQIGGTGIEVASFFEITINPIMDVMSALVTAFILGLGIAAVDGKTLYGAVSEFQKIIVGSKEEYDRIMANKKTVTDYKEVK